MGRLSNQYAAVLRSVIDSKKLGSVSYAAEALYFRLLCASDGAGRFHGDAFDVAAKALTPRARRGAAGAREVEAWLTELIDAGLLERYEVDGEQVVSIVGFWKPASQRLPERFMPPPGARPTPVGANVTPVGVSPAPVGAGGDTDGCGKGKGIMERENGDGERASARDGTSQIEKHFGDLPEHLRSPARDVFEVHRGRVEERVFASKGALGRIGAPSFLEALRARVLAFASDATPKAQKDPERQQVAVRAALKREKPEARIYELIERAERGAGEVAYVKAALREIVQGGV